MPVHQISVVPVAKETASNNRTSNKNEANSLKAGPSQTVSASSHDVCSGETKLDADGSDQTTPVVPINPASTTKPPVKRRVRRRRGSTGAVGCAADRRRPPGARGLVRGSADSSSEDERRLRESRSWSREKARRRRSSGRQRSDQRQDDVQLLSVNSDEKENQPPQGPVAKLHPHRKSTSKSEERASQSEPAIQQRRSDGGSSGAGSRDEEEEAPITPSNENRGSDEVGVSAPPPDKRPDPAGHNGGSQHACSDDELEVCRICHCEGDAECPLITPCRCTGSLRFVHHGCLHQWIKSSDTRCCELCKYDFIMETQLKPLRKWEKLHMTRSERRKIFCAVFFHMVALVCVLWSVYVLVQRTIDDLQHGRNAALLRLSPLAALGLLEWPFWAKLTVVSMGVAGGLLFMYVQCKVYLQLWRRLKAFNRIIFVQNCPDTVRPPPPPVSEAPPSESITPV